MKKLLLIAFTATACISEINAQVTVKKDILTYYSMLPPMPGGLQEAYQKCICKSAACSADSLVAPINRNTNADMKAMGNMTATQQQQVQNGQQLYNQMQKDNVNKMNDNQKLEYAKNNNQLNGGNPDAMAFAQKMKNDPAEKAKFQAMTPDQKMAYMKQNGLFNNTGAAPVAAPDSDKATDALNKEKKLEAAEGPDKQKLVQALQDKLNDANLRAAHDKIDQLKQAELNKLPSGGGEGGGNSGPAAKAIESRYMQQHLALAENQLKDMVKAYQDLYNYLMNAATPFCNALTPISYGYTGEPNQDTELNKLAMGQGYVLNDIQQLAGFAKNIYEFAATWKARAKQL